MSPTRYRFSTPHYNSGEPGFEPGQTESKSGVLPLDDSPMEYTICWGRDSNPQAKGIRTSSVHVYQFHHLSTRLYVNYNNLLLKININSNFWKTDFNPLFILEDFSPPVISNIVRNPLKRPPHQPSPHREGDLTFPPRDCKSHKSPLSGGDLREVEKRAEGWRRLKKGYPILYLK